MTAKRFIRCALFISAVLFPFAAGLFSSSARSGWPAVFDVRGPEGVPKGTNLRRPAESQLAALAALQREVGAPLTVQYNGLTATPRHLFSRGRYLSAPSNAAPEQVARDFISRWRGLFRFSDRDLAALRLKSRATIRDIGATVLYLSQQVNGADVYDGGVLVNVSRSGQVISLGNDNFPRLAITNDITTTPAQAVTSAAASLGVENFAPAQKGTRRVPSTFGDLPPMSVEAPLFDGGGVFSDDIAVETVVFPMGDTGRWAYKLTLTTPQFESFMWESIVDAQTGEVLRRASLTSHYGPRGGGLSGTGVGRLGTFRPDVQDLVEGFNDPTAPTAVAKVTEGAPTALSGVLGFGRSTAPGVAPAYGPATAATIQEGRSFKQGQVFARSANPLVYGPGFGQVERGIPDAAHPSPSSPFGWFYLPTGENGAEITSANTNRATTRAYGYNMHAAARTRNLAENSPAGDKNQPFSATTTPLAAPVTLKDGRVLTSVIQSNYTEGNNVVVADDHQNDNETTHGIKGYDPARRFTAPRFDYTMGYEYGNVDAATNSIPPTAFPDVYPATLTLFYYNNIMHDYLYSIGFTEPLWNFQQDNFGNGGRGADGVSAQVQDGSGTNNANFSTPADGSRPRMQMYLFTETGFRRADGDFDFDVVAHEFYHGVSNRSAGKGSTGCLGLGSPFPSESGGQGEGWSDTIAQSIMDDDATGEFATGEHDRGIRLIPVTNFRYSYGALNGRGRNRRDFPAPPDSNQSTSVNTASTPPATLPFQVHYVGTIFSAMTWDMRELLIMKQKVDGQFPGVFFDGARRLGSGTPFYIGERLVHSVDTRHPIDYRESFGTTTFTTSNSTANGTPTTPQLVITPTIAGTEHINRPGLVQQEIAARGDRQGLLATALSRGARLADTLVLRGLQLGPCSPSIVDTRDAILLADRELTGGENQAVIWRAFASHGVGLLASSTAGTGNEQGVPATGSGATTAAPVIVEDFNVPPGVTQCEQLGPLPAPAFALSNPSDNRARIVINNGSPVPNAATYLIRRADNADGPYTQVAEIPASQTSYDDNSLAHDRTYFYQVRATRSDGNPVAPAANRECVSSSETKSIFVTGVALNLPPIFAGVDRADDPKDGSRLIVSWQAATSLNPESQIVYDVYRVPHVDHGDGTQEPTFTPEAGNRVTPPEGVTGTSYVDTGLVMAQPYYYIVQARDTNNGLIDTGNAGNRRVRFNAPTIPQLGTPTFALEDFEDPPAAGRFTPAPTESGSNPNQNSATFQRVAGETLGGVPTAGKMYAPNFSPGHEDPTTRATCATANNGCGGPSDFYAQIGPFNGPGNPALTSTSIMEFDHAFNQEAAFDGGVLEVKVGAPFEAGDATPYPDNTEVFDLGNYIIEGGYNSKLDGLTQPPAPVRGSPLQGRRAYTGAKTLHRVRVTLRNFAPGGLHNPQGQPVYVRFRMTSDVASANGVDAGWYIDNLVVNNLACLVNFAAANAGALASATTSYSSRNYSPEGAIDGDRKGLNWESGGGWNDSTRGVWPDALEVAFGGPREIREVRVYTVQNDFRNPVEPDETTPANLYGLIDFDVQTWDGSSWVTVGQVRGNDRAMRAVTFPGVTTSKIRINVLAAREHFSRIVEVEAFGCQ